MANIFKDKDLLSKKGTDLSKIFNESFDAYFYHLLITGWSENHNISDHFYSFDLYTSKRATFQKDGFYCIDFCLDYYNFKSDHEVISDTINKCLKLFHNYINVALAYGNDKNEIEYFYKTQISYNESKKVDELLERIIDFSKFKVPKVMCNFSDILLERYIKPGIEDHRVASGDVDTNQFEELNQIIRYSGCFSDILNEEVNGNSFHLYNHPKRSFPLPILLKSLEDKSMADIWNSNEWQRDNVEGVYDDFIPNESFLVLGYYSHNPEDECEGPHIILCLENISKMAKEMKMDNKLLCLIVLIHEFAHAKMDMYQTKSSIKSFFAQAMEESLANMITLKWFEEHDEDNFDCVLQFVNSQPPIYQFGIKQFNAKVDCTKWSRSSKDMKGLLKVWFDTCFIEKCELASVKEAYDKVFKMQI